MKKLLIPLLALFSCTKIGTAHYAAQVESNVTTRPNIVLILGDDVGYENVTADGGQSYETPHLDAMAANGTRYTQGHATPLCSPSRFMLLTGKYNFRNYTQWGVMDPAERTIANMLQDAGYATAVYGKWQLDGGEASIHSLGFEDYCIYNAFNDRTEDGELFQRYKNPQIYRNDSVIQYTNNEYGEDIFTDSLIAFMHKPRTNPFFIYYPMTLVHVPHQPTPDDADYLSFDETNGNSDHQYYPSMMKYMDKKIGQIMRELPENTVVIFIGDNGTSGAIKSLFNGELIKGGKHKTTEYGTHVPMIVKGYGVGIDTQLVDLTDFMPTLAQMAGIPTPTTYGTLDGTNFLGTTRRQTIYCWFWPNPNRSDSSRQSIWVQGYVYKRYTTADPDYKTDAFFRFSTFPKEREINVIDSLTLSQQKIYDKYGSIINSYK